MIKKEILMKLVNTYFESHLSATHTTVIKLIEDAERYNENSNEKTEE